MPRGELLGGLEVLRDGGEREHGLAGYAELEHLVAAGRLLARPPAALEADAWETPEAPALVGHHACHGLQHAICVSRVQQLAAGQSAVEGRARLERPHRSPEGAPAARVRLALQHGLP